MHIFYTQLSAVVLLAHLTVAPQAPPNLSGVWVPVEVSPKPANRETALPPSDITVSQSAAVLTITRTAFDQTMTTTYSLSGREDTNKSGAVTRVTRSKWDATSLVTEGRMSQVTSQGYAAWTLKETIGLDHGGRLVIRNETVSDKGDTHVGIATYRRKEGSR
jgi:hypothetical protein